MLQLWKIRTHLDVLQIRLFSIVHWFAAEELITVPYILVRDECLKWICLGNLA